MSQHLVGLTEIGGMLGVSRQRVSQLVETYPDFPAPSAELAAGRIWLRAAVELWMQTHPERGPGKEPRAMGPDSGFYEKFSDRGKYVLIVAQEEARTLVHSWIGTEHLLLGVLREDGGDAKRALVNVGLTHREGRKQVTKLIGKTREAPPGLIPFTPRARNVLLMAAGLRDDGSVRTAIEPRDIPKTLIEPEQILAALVAEGDGVAAKILKEFGFTSLDDVARALRDAGLDESDVSRQLTALGSRLEAIEKRLSSA